MSDERHDPRGRRPAAERAAARGGPRARAATRCDRRPRARRRSTLLAGDGRRPRAARHRDAGDGRLRGLPRACATDPATRVPAVVMITASGDQEKRRGDRGRRRRLHREAVRPGRAAGARALAAADQAVPRHDRARRRRARRVEPASSSSASRSRSTSSSAGPAAAVPVAAARRPRRLLRRRAFLESHRREITVVFCDLRGFTPFAETAEPEEVMEVLRRVPRGARRADPPLRGHARALHRRRADGLLQRPAPVRRRAAARGRGWRSRCASGWRSSREDWQPRGPRPRLRRRHRPGLRDARPDRLRGALRLRRDRHRHEPRRPPVRRGGAGPDPRSASACTPRPRS